MSQKGVVIGLSAVIVSVDQAEPKVFVVNDADHGEMNQNTSGQDKTVDAVPFGAFDPEHHETLELGLREWVKTQTPLTPGYVEQLYTFGNKGRYLGQGAETPRVISVGYLALTCYQDRHDIRDSDRFRWATWYDYFPWEDFRQGRPDMIDDFIIPHLESWAKREQDPDMRAEYFRTIDVCFSRKGAKWDEEKILERYELLYTARMVDEACRDKDLDPDTHPIVKSRAMRFDHRRILATAIGRLRGKLKYRPVIFEVMPDDFTLLELQRTVEALGGHNLHKQNFRRFVENSGMVEETGRTTNRGGGRPANLFQFRQDVMFERHAPGVRLSPAKAS